VCSQENVELVYVTYHVDVGETPFFIGIDYDMSKIVISIRGTLSMKDIMTDLNAESELLPLQPVREEWKGHKGMVQAAEYIHGKLIQENLLERAFNWRKERGTDKFALVCVGHSLGGGTAAILAIILRQQYPDVTCYSYSPPGGLLSEEAMLASRDFMTSVVVGKDVVPRIGMHQLETLRHDLMETIKKSEESKWRRSRNLKKANGRRLLGQWLAAHHRMRKRHWALTLGQQQSTSIQWTAPSIFLFISLSTLLVGSYTLSGTIQKSGSEAMPQYTRQSGPTIETLTRC